MGVRFRIGMTSVLLVIALLTRSFSGQQRPSPEQLTVPLGAQLDFKSGVLNESIPIQIFAPSTYESAKTSYPTLPVIYVLDGPTHYPHTASLVEFLSKVDRIPPAIVVGVGTNDRNRDLTPTQSVFTQFGKLDVTTALSGGGAAYSRFLREELMPYVERNYRAAPFRILMGQSFGGLFTVNMLLDHPEAFQAYFASSPSLWWDNQVTLKRAGAIGRRETLLFLSVGNEGGKHRESIDSFVDLLKGRAIRGMTWEYKVYQDEKHGTVAHSGLDDALRFIFRDWDILTTRDRATFVTYQDVVDHYRRLSERFGYAVPVPESVSVALAARLSSQDRLDDAIRAYGVALERNPRSVPALLGLATVYARQGDRGAAVAELEKVLAISPTNVAAKGALAYLKK